MIPTSSDTRSEWRREVLNLLDMGESYSSIAERVGVSTEYVIHFVELRDRFHICGSCGVKLIQFYRESTSDVPNANDPIEGEVIEKHFAEQIMIRAKIDADIAEGFSLVPDTLNGPNAKLLPNPIVLAILIALSLALFLAMRVRSLL